MGATQIVDRSLHAFSPISNFSPHFDKKKRKNLQKSYIYSFMLTLFSGCPFPWVKCLWSLDLCLIAKETTRDSWTWV